MNEFRTHKPHTAKIPAISRDHPSGFALIATILIMSLLMLVSLALVSLSSVETRTGAQGVHQIEAKANARLAMLLALAELQKMMGPDQSINAVSQILDDPTASSTSLAHSRLTGVWSSRDDELGTQPDYSRDTPFRGWLVSGNDLEALKDLSFAESGNFSDPVPLVGARTAGSSAPENYVTAGKINVGTGKGAWWIGDENSKALSFPRDKKELAGNMELAEHLARFATPGVHGMKSLEALETLDTNTEEVSKVISNGQLAYYADSKSGSDSRLYFHDLTTHSQSVLSNVSKGGLKKDLNLYLERDDLDWLAESHSQWPIGPNGEKALSPIDEYDVLSWKQLHHHYHSHRMVNYVGDRPQLTHIRSDAAANAIVNPKWNSGVTRPSIVPVRVQFFLAFSTISKDGADVDKIDKTYDLRLHVYPVLTLWNPYNVDLKVDGYHILFNTLPLKHIISLNGMEKQTYNWGKGENNKDGVASLLSIENITFKAGESINFYPVQDAWKPETGNNRHYLHEMQPIPYLFNGMDNKGAPWGVGGDAINDTPLTVSGKWDDIITIKTLPNNYDDGDGAFGELQSTFGWRGQDQYERDGRFAQHLWSSKVAWRHETSDPRPDEFSTNNGTKDTLETLEKAARPFCVIDARLKPLDGDKLKNKTWLHSIPVHSYAAATQGSNHNSYFSNAYTVSFRGIHSFEAIGNEFYRVPGNDNVGKFGTSYFADGQTYITGREVPLVPLTSLAQLQNLPQHPIDALHWSGIGLQNNAIANSFASPFIQSDSIKESAESFYLNGYINNFGDLNGTRSPFGQFIAGTSYIDRSYAANHLLWDEYFFSSMAAQDGSFYSNNGSTRNLHEVINDFYGEDQSQLPNARYVPYATDNTSAIVDSLVNAAGKATSDGYKKSAAHLMVSGGFNINSVSEVAWANLIASAHLKRPVVLEADSTESPSLENEGQFIVSRYSLPNGKMVSGGSDDLKWRSYRELTTEEIEQLAKAIVVQVKTRGPFRSLGEFINRRLAGSSDEESLYGALQAALEDPSVTINEDLRTEQITAEDIADASYEYTEAALGPRAQGAPAYITQADILQPIAPIITARSDTFIIRSYGESRSADGSRVMASVWCETVVQRYPDYVDTIDDPEVEHSDLTSDINKQFGRRFRIISFRWLSENEI